MGCSVLSAGWRLGKAVAIAGAAVSSAPMVLPPLLISAALGFAFSVPSGLLFAGYVCNEKVMSCLLSSPSPSQEDQLGLLCSEEEEEEEDIVGQKAKGKEEVLQREDYEMRVSRTEINIPDSVDDVLVQESLVHVGYRFEESNKEEYEYESLEDKLVAEMEKYGRHEIDDTGKEDMGLEQYTLGRPNEEQMEYWKTSTGEDIEDEVEMRNRSSREEMSSMMSEELDGSQDYSALQLQIELDESRLVMPEEGVTSVVQREVLVDEYRVSLSNKSGNLQHSVDATAGEEDHVELSVEHVAYSFITTEVDSAMEVIMEEPGSHEDTVEQPVPLFTPDGASSEVKLAAKPCEDEGVSLQLQNELDESPLMMPKEVVTVEAQYSVVDREVLVDEYRVSLSDTSGNQQHSVNGKAGEDVEVSVEHVVYSSTTTEVNSAMEVLMEEPSSSEDTVEQPNPLFAPDGVYSEVRLAAKPSDDEGIYTEEEIWEQINALRLIIGYNADRQASSMEELKALYIFTGVEPPASFAAPHDLVDANNNLRFLKSVVGIK